MRFLAYSFRTALALASLLCASAAFGQVKVVNMIPNSLSGETQRDSEPNVAVNPANPLRIAASAFTPDPGNSGSGPIFVSTDGGNTWVLNVILPGGNKTGDTSIRFGGNSGVLYGGILRSDASLRMNILRKADFTTAGLMDVLVTRDNEDQPWLEAATASGQDRVFVGNNNLGAASGRTASVDPSQNAATAAAPAGFSTSVIEVRNTGTGGQDGPPIRTAHHADGTVYAVFYGWTAASGSTKTSDIVVVRDDSWGNTGTPFGALTDTDGNAGTRVVTGTTVVFNQMLGTQRTGGQAAIAVDPNNSSTVYIAWGDGTPAFTLHVRRSTDQGVTWSSDLRTIASATNPGLAVNSAGSVGFLYQRLVNPGSGNRWETHLERSKDGFTSAPVDIILANVSDSTGSYGGPNPIGDYSNLVAVGKKFYGVFSAFNTPIAANFPQNVVYQRNANFSTNQLLATDGTTVVADSIDPFFFSVAESGHIEIPAGVAFGKVCIGSTGRATLNVCNTGDGNLTVSSISSSNPSVFAVTAPSAGFPIVISPGACFPFEVTYKPSGIGPQTGTLTISSDDPAHPSVNVQATGQSAGGLLGLSPNVRFSPTVIQSLGPCQSAKPFVISNTGTCDLTITNITIGGANPGDYSLSGLPAFPITLQPGHIAGAGDLNIVLAPTALARERTANISVTFVSDPGTGATSVQTRELCGEGVLTGARVLVTQGGVPMPLVHEIELKRVRGGFLGWFDKEVDEVKNAPLQNVTPSPGSACAAFPFHREYAAITNPTQLRPGLYQLKVEAKIAGKEVRKKVFFKINTCNFNGTIVVDF